MKKQVSILCVLGAFVGSLHAAPATFDSFCFKCHDATQSDGDLDLEALTARKADPAQWPVLRSGVRQVSQRKRLWRLCAKCVFQS